MSPLSLYFDTIDVIEEFLDNLKHLNGRVRVSTKVTKKSYGCFVVICVKNRSLDCLDYTTLLCVKSLRNFNFLTSILSHINNLCIEMCNRMDIDSDSDNN